MKKIIITTLMALWCTIGLSQNNLTDYYFPLNNGGQEEFKEVVDVDNTKEVLFSNAKEWIAKTFGNYKSVIQFEDESSGKLILKGRSSIETIKKTLIMTLSEAMKYTVTIECKDNRYRYTISDIEIIETMALLGSKHSETTTHNSHFENLDQSRSNLSSSLRQVDSLKSIDRSQLKKREVKELEEKIISEKEDLAIHISHIKAENSFIKEEFASIESLIKSLKDVMKEKDDF